jgi:hypothetical protein
MKYQAMTFVSTGLFMIVLSGTLLHERVAFHVKKEMTIGDTCWYTETVDYDCPAWTPGTFCAIADFFEEKGSCKSETMTDAEQLRTGGTSTEVPSLSPKCPADGDYYCFPSNYMFFGTWVKRIGTTVKSCPKHYNKYRLNDNCTDTGI